jgi:hypothetical protein
MKFLEGVATQSSRNHGLYKGAGPECLSLISAHSYCIVSIPLLTEKTTKASGENRTVLGIIEQASV